MEYGQLWLELVFPVAVCNAQSNTGHNKANLTRTNTFSFSQKKKSART
jgi:hypothetical protein